MKVIIFDDEPDVLRLYKLILQKKGYDVNTYENCNTLFETVASINPDVIIMDNEMPGKSGIQATKDLKHNRLFQGIPIIICTANSEGSQLAMDAHADMFLPKPFSINGLEDAIRKVTLNVA